MIVSLAGAMPVRVEAQGARADVPGASTAKGAMVLRAVFPGTTDVDLVSIRYSLDGKTFHPGEVGRPREWELFRSVSYGEQGTTVLIVVIGGWGPPAEFLMAAPGTYWFQWRITFRGEGADPLEIPQVVKVGPTSQADDGFLTRVSQPTFLRSLFGDDFFERKTEAIRERLLASDGVNFRAMIVLGPLFDATRARDPSGVVGVFGGDGRTP